MSNASIHTVLKNSNSERGNTSIYSSIGINRDWINTKTIKQSICLTTVNEKPYTIYSSFHPDSTYIDLRTRDVHRLQKFITYTIENVCKVLFIFLVNCGTLLLVNVYFFLAKISLTYIPRFYFCSFICIFITDCKN